LLIFYYLRIIRLYFLDYSKMEHQDLPSSEANWRALMLRAIASKCRKGMTDTRDADVLEQMASEIAASTQYSSRFEIS
jgi:hypothetical protein